jgi:hypothetical protein
LSFRDLVAEPTVVEDHVFEDEVSGIPVRRKVIAIAPEPRVFALSREPRIYPLEAQRRVYSVAREV